MVQIIPAAERKLSFSQKLAQGVNRGLEKGFELYGEHQKKQKEEREYQEENEAVKKAGIDLSGIRNQKMREKGFELGLKGKSKAEENAAKLAVEEKTQKQLISFSDKLESNNPNSPMHRTVADIYRTDLPMDQKKQLVQSLTGMDPFKMEQQRRLQMDSVLKRYNSRIKELQQSIKDARYNERAPLQQQLKDLQDERDDLLDFKALNGIEDEEDVEMEDKEDEGPKVKFDPNNKEHKAKADQLYKKYKDKEIVRKKLSKEFKGL